MGKIKKLKNTAKQRHAPFNEQLSNTVKAKKRISKGEDDSTLDDMQVKGLRW